MKDNELTLDKFKNRIGHNIRIIREFKKITQQSLYEHINKSQATLSRYENGKSTMSIDTLYKICQFLDIPIEIMISKDLSYDDYSYINPNKKNKISKDYTHYFEEKMLNLYYLSTSQNNLVIQSDLLTAELVQDNYIPFLFEVKHNSPDKQIYEGSLVLEAQHAYFYFKNKNRNERGLIITYLYPQKNKDTPITLLGLMISISHGYEQRPCTQKCFISSQKIDLETLKPFLKMDAQEELFVNSNFITFLTKASDRKIYDWINDTDSV